MTSLTMEAKDPEQKGNTLKVNLAITNNASGHFLTTALSPKYVIGGCIVFQVRVVAGCVSNGLQNFVFIRFVKHCPDDNLTYTIKFTSSIFGIKNKCFNSDDGTWHLVNENQNLKQYNFDVAIQMDIVPSANNFSPLHEDMKLTNFDLRGVDGSVRFHKAVLAASSPVLRTMLAGTWRETTEGHVVVPGTSKKTLQHLKNYMYLRTLPDQGLKQLAILASYYMMPELEQSCADRLVNSITDENACELLEFAASNKLTRLILAIMACVQNRAVDVNETRRHFLRGESEIKYRFDRNFSADDKMSKHNNNEDEQCERKDKQDQKCDKDD